MFIGNPVNLLFPRRCALCDGLLEGKELYVCADCRENVRFIRGPVCEKCGRPVEKSFKLCRSCSENEYSFEKSISPYKYSGEMRQSVLRFKYSGRAEYAEFFARSIAVYAKESIKKWAPDILIPVPIHPSRLRKRGYNQSALIARRLAGEFEIPEDEKILLRRKRTKPQMQLDVAARRRNVERAFACRKNRKVPKTVLLVDDILTTGSTLNACAEELKRAGAGRVYALCLCVDE